MKRRNALIALASCLLRPAIAAPEQAKGVLDRLNLCYR